MKKNVPSATPPGCIGSLFIPIVMNLRQTYDDREQESQTELLNAQAIIDKQKSQIEELNVKISSLENKLKDYNNHQ